MQKKNSANSFFFPPPPVWFADNTTSGSALFLFIFHGYIICISSFLSDSLARETCTAFVCFNFLIFIFFFAGVIRCLALFNFNLIILNLAPNLDPFSDLNSIYGNLTCICSWKIEFGSGWLSNRPRFFVEKITKACPLCLFCRLREHFSSFIWWPFFFFILGLVYHPYSLKLGIADGASGSAVRFVPSISF